eukprot:CAMPEP_0171494120 /NCGR_PEP_ID=MMETSP0958-20121227/5339_1 /TAXON_ID=87120 /ORGANISM="Aurantiochytrium limacinum, Strain ATCCMYA-1381" /LENGTH=368 /DNA_ID=CAMNT_0012027815 /DNA_START=90 /DNA_END=1200 /DNA_ORIENTATION=+
MSVGRDGSNSTQGANDTPEHREASAAVLRRSLSNEGVQVDFAADEQDAVLLRHVSGGDLDGDFDDDEDQLTSDTSPVHGGVREAFLFYGAKFALTGTSAMLAESATFPIEQIKVRQQLSTTSGSGFLSTAAHAVKSEGIQGLYKGLAPAVLRHVPYTGSRILLYDKLRGVFIQEDGSAPFVSKLFVGFTSGAVGQTIAVPTDLVKIRLIGDAQKAESQRRYKGLLDAFRKIPREEGGILALWSGSSPAILRAALVNLGELATYDAAKRNWLATGLVEDDFRCHVLSAAASGLVASFVSCPADVVKSRIMNNSKAYNGILDCAVRTVKAEGTLAMWKGFFPTWARLAPWQAVFWVSYEQLLRLSGMGSF